MVILFQNYIINRVVFISIIGGFYVVIGLYGNNTQAGGGIDENSVLRLFYYKLIEVQLLSV